MGMDMDMPTSGNGFCHGEGYVMLNGFQKSEGGDCVLFLFEGAVVDTRTRYVFALLGAMSLGIVVEVLRAGRARLSQTRLLEEKLGVFGMDVLDGLLFAVQMMVAYWLMLLAMLYEYGIFILILVGLAIGRVLSRRMERATAAAIRRQGEKALLGGAAACSPCCGDA